MADAASAVTHTLIEIRAWIASRLAHELGLGESDIAGDEAFDVYGLDSLNAAVIAGELEDWFGRPLSASLLYEYPTLDALATYLASLGASDASGASDAPPSAEDGGREAGLLGVVTGGKRLRLRERIARFAEFRATLPAEAYLRVIEGPADRETQVIDSASGESRRMLMFGSNNYLGLASHPLVIERASAAIQKYGIGLAGPAVLNGYTGVHRELEERLSAFKHTEDTILFPTGYAANLGLISSLPVRGDSIHFDQVIHASVYDGLRLCPARFVDFPHNDVDALARQLAERTGGGDAFVVVEGVYSMDGDLAPLDEIVPVCKRHGATLIVDDAHGTGVLGATGSGTVEHFGLAGQVPIQVGTFSKAFGAVGGFISADRDTISYLRFLARSYTFSAALPPSAAAAVLAGLEVLASEPERLTRLHDNVQYATEALARVGIEIHPSAAILALLAPPTMDVRKAARMFHASGIFLNAVEYPAVAPDKERFRVGIMSSHTRDDIDRLVECVAGVWAAFDRGELTRDRTGDEPPA